jgi:hypothetical protein
MAERIVSPGVFTQERDQSFLAQGVAQIGAAFVGPTTKGPAFIPTSVDGIDGFVTTFGEPDGTSYMGYAVKNYLQEAGSATIVRVLGTAGYNPRVVSVFATGSAGKKVFAILHPTISGSNNGTVDISSVTVGNGTDTNNFSLRVVGNTISSASGLSTSTTSTSFIQTVFGTNPQSLTSGSVYCYAVFPNAISQAGSQVTMSAETASLNLSRAYSNATTPWIKSQTIGGSKYDLFRFHTLSDGTNSNTDIKVSIVGVAPSSNPDSAYGTFSVQIRALGDTDNSINLLESSYDNLTLDPNSPNYIARVIGNSAPFYDVSGSGETYYEGEFRNNSKYIRVEMSPNTIPENAVPYGFGSLVAIMSGSASDLPTASLVTSRYDTGFYTTASRDLRSYYGYNFTNLTNLSYLAPTINGAATIVNNDFNIEGLAEVPTDVAPFSRSIRLDSGSDVGYRKFTVPFQGGFDGLNPARFIAMGAAITDTNSQGFNLANAAAAGSVSYKRALDALSNPDNVDLNLIVIPGAIYRLHSYITQYAIDLCESRGDCFYIMDLTTLNDNIQTAVNEAAELDTNYAAAYYPWVRVTDTNTNKEMWAPPSVVLPEVYAYSDNVGAEWFAPAGLNRGGIPGAIGVKSRLSQNDRDNLYEGKVNPIAQFPGQGVCVWGQKTLQRRASALDRVNVRRLLITVKKFIASSARYLVFEQNTEATRNRFLNIVNPYLAGIQQRSGLTAFRVVMDETNNTPDIIDRNILAGAIYLQPTRTAEFIKLDFNILPTGATFDTI